MDSNVQVAIFHSFDRRALKFGTVVKVDEKLSQAKFGRKPSKPGGGGRVCRFLGFCGLYPPFVNKP